MSLHFYLKWGESTLHMVCPCSLNLNTLIASNGCTLWFIALKLHCYMLDFTITVLSEICTLYGT
jgi:hypothetical protein